MFLECPNCWGEVKENWKFCPYCGEDLETDQKGPICFTVRSKDLFDREKNPDLKLDVASTIENDKIPKRFLI